MKLDMRHPDIMRRTSGGGLLILFGQPFFAAGLFVIGASLERLSVERRGLLFNKTQAIPTDELEELILPGNREEEGARNVLEKSNLPNGVKAFLGTLVQSQSRSILARSDTTALEFGKELPEDERRWIHAVIVRMMTS